MAQKGKPNIVVIFGDDIGMWNVGAYTHGMMGRTPNIDRIAKNGILFTDHYGQPSCTAGRAAFITGQMPDPHRHDHHRHPGLDARHPEGRSDARRGAEVRRLRRPASSARTISAIATSSCRPMHGFDEWFGNLYHLNAEEEPEELDYPGQKNPAYLKKFGPRGVLHTWATDHGRSDRGSEVRPRRQAEDRGHRPAHAQAHGDLRRRGARQDARLAGPQRQERQAVLRLVQHHRHPHLVAPARRSTSRWRSTRDVPKRTSCAPR